MPKLSKELVADNGEKITVFYSVFTNNSSYGISIEVLSDDEKLADFVKIEDITVNLLEINRIFMLLYNYEVTPVTVFDVLDNYFADSEYFESLI